MKYFMKPCCGARVPCEKTYHTLKNNSDGTDEDGAEYTTYDFSVSRFLINDQVGRQNRSHHPYDIGTDHLPGVALLKGSF